MRHPRFRRHNIAKVPEKAEQPVHELPQAAYLSFEDVRLIENLKDDDFLTYDQLAEQMGVSKSAVHQQMRKHDIEKLRGEDRIVRFRKSDIKRVLGID